MHQNTWFCTALFHLFLLYNFLFIRLAITVALKLQINKYINVAELYIQWRRLTKNGGGETCLEGAHDQP